jgi:hypothetical protein
VKGLGGGEAKIIAQGETKKKIRAPKQFEKKLRAKT